MAKLLYTDVGADGVLTETFIDEVSMEITIKRHDDAQAALDAVAAVNAVGAPTLDGIGKPVMEIPIVLAMDWAQKRGIPWEKLLYSNDYDAEFKRFGQAYSRLCYENRKSVHTVQ
jgi:hypothetical protein